MIDAVYFDLDGTLFDDRQYIDAGLRRAGKVLADETGHDLTDELLAAYFERRITESTFDTVLDEHDLSPDFVQLLVDAYHDNRAALSPFPAAKTTLRRLSERYRLGVITGGTNGRDKLTRLGLDEFFETVFVSPVFGSSKRNPDIFEAALDALDAKANAAVYVGDRPVLDFPQPNRLGMTTVRIKTGRYSEAVATDDTRPDYVLKSLDGLPAVVDDIGSCGQKVAKDDR